MTDDETIRAAMSALAKRRSAGLTAEERSAIASAGGKARAKSLSAKRRKEIAAAAGRSARKQPPIAAER